jgi:peptidoglycan/LPS O-acetylase OafA/YrhL
MRKFAYIDALRGYAILMVLAVHTSQFYSQLPYAAVKLAEQGARGVQLFFVVSAITLCMSWQARDDGAAAFYIRRLFRIAPMFWLAIPFYLWRNGVGPTIYAPDGIGARHVLMTATFSHGLAPDTITSVVPGSWSIADEMMFYAVFPLLAIGLGRVRFFVAAGAAILLTYACLRIQWRSDIYVAYMADPVWRATWATFTSLWFIQQLPCFLFGMLAFKWAEQGGAVPWPRTLIGLSICGMVLLAFYHAPDYVVPYISRLGLAIPYGFLFALFALGLMHWQPRALVNPAVCWIGKVSFSAYLIHFAVIGHITPSTSYAVTYAMIAAITVALSSITYLAIEQPFTRLGHRVASRYAGAAGAPVDQARAAAT